MLKYLSHTGEFTFKITPKGRKLKYEKMICVCGKLVNVRLDTKKYDSCGCIGIENSKTKIELGKEYKNIIPIKEIENFISSTGVTKRRQFLYKCKICLKEGKILVDRIGKQDNCGCNINKKHGKCFTGEYYSYSGIIQRCNNPNNVAYKNYGGRGIKCEWTSFEDFYKDMGESYKKGLTIERIDNNGNYCKSNCKWATRTEQTRNRRNTLIFHGIPLVKICEDRGISYRLTYKRIHELGWSFTKALNFNNEK